MVDLGAVQLLCNTSEGEGGKQKYDFVLCGGKGGGLERGQIVLHND